MISRLKRRFRRALAIGRPLLRVAGSNGQTVEVQHSIIDVLIDARSVGDPVRLRDVHRLVGTSQPHALRCIRSLQERSVIEIDESIHDPLASEIRLK